MTGRRWHPAVRAAGALVILAAWAALLVPAWALARRARELWPAWQDYRAQAVAQRAAEDDGLLVEHPVLGWVPRAGADWPIAPVAGEHEGGRWQIDARGLRAGDAVGGGRPRVVALGDSFTFGTGPWEDGWPAQLGIRLDGAEVLDLGVPEYDLGQVLLRWEAQGRELVPEVVVIAVIRAMLVRSHAARAYSGRARPLFTLDAGGGLVRPAGPLDAPLPAGRALDGPFGFLRFVATGVLQGEVHAAPVDPALPGALLDALLTDVRAHDARPVLAYLPIRGEGRDDAADVVIAAAARHETPLVDLRRVFAEHGDPAPVDGPWFLPDQHYNRRANGLLADALAPIVAPDPPPAP